jgi:sulfide:quinone oxidoreductase
MTAGPGTPKLLDMLAEEQVRHDPVRVVIAGGGVAALEALVALGSLVRRRLDATLVAPAEHFVYRPLQVGEPFGLGQARRYPLASLCRELGAKFVRDAVTSIDGEAHTVKLAGGPELEYDILLLAAGAHAYPAFEHGAIFDRETAPADFDEVLSATGGRLAEHVAIVVPDGVSWTLPAYELAMLTAGYFPGSKVTLVTYEHAPLAAFGTTASSAVAEILSSAGVSLRVGQRPVIASPTALRLGWEWLEAGRIVTLPLLRGNPIGGVPADEHGFIPVDGYGRVAGLEDVYAAGDGADLPIKQGGLASQLADAAAMHIAARLGEDVNARPLSAILRGLLLTTEGARYLRAELADPDRTSAISTEPLWWPPGKIASRWLAPFLERSDARNEAGFITAHC